MIWPETERNSPDSTTRGIDKQNMELWRIGQVNWSIGWWLKSHWAFNPNTSYLVWFGERSLFVPSIGQKKQTLGQLCNKIGSPKWGISEIRHHNHEMPWGSMTNCTWWFAKTRWTVPRAVPLLVMTNSLRTWTWPIYSLFIYLLNIVILWFSSSLFNSLPWTINIVHSLLVGGFNPSEKYKSQLGSLFPIYYGK